MKMYHVSLCSSVPKTSSASEMKSPNEGPDELMRYHVCRVWSRWIVFFWAGAVSRHYYHYFASAFVQETAVEFWVRFKVAGPGVVLVHSANLALTWWLLAEFCAELNICDNRQHHWPVLPRSLPFSFSSVFTHFSLCVLHLSLPSRIAPFEG